MEKIVRAIHGVIPAKKVQIRKEVVHVRNGKYKKHSLLIELHNPVSEREAILADIEGRLKGMGFQAAAKNLSDI